ncbi:MAG: 2-hydroxyacyl-CoA dehydratase [Lachnospiraceae bacterium]|nr:2-hydroxyacyl-CoA dehydratase [Lachnospiraceae bacterium]
MSELHLPDNFETFPEARKKAFLTMKELKEKGTRIVGTFCTYTPAELVTAADAVAVGLCGISEELIPPAEVRLPKNLCPLIKASYGGAVSGKCPFFYFSDMILAETTCDGKKKMYELLGELKHTHVMQLPPGKTGVKALEFWKAEVVDLKEDLEQFYGIEISDDKLQEAIKLRNRERKAILDFFEIGKLKPTPLSGYEINTIISSNDYNVDIEGKIKYLEKRTAELKEIYETKFRGKPSRPRILITGCPTTGVMDKVIKRIEELGADVVGFENCCGPREKKDPIDETMDPITAIAEKYLRVNCSVMSPNPGRLEALDQQIDEYQIDGVVEVLLQACHTFAVEADSVKTFVQNQKQLPYIAINTDYSVSDQAQIDTRLGAFIELLNCQ